MYICIICNVGLFVWFPFFIEWRTIDLTCAKRRWIIAFAIHTIFVSFSWEFNYSFILLLFAFSTAICSLKLHALYNFSFTLGARYCCYFFLCVFLSYLLSICTVVTVFLDLDRNSFCFRKKNFLMHALNKWINVF